MTNIDPTTTRERAARLGHRLNALVAIFDAPVRLPEGPLHGLPVAVKDIIDIMGHPRGNGNPEAMASAPACSDAPVVAALREAGADVFAATSLLEYAAGATHPLVPETRNPFDPSRTAGGSSGGSAAIVGVGACSVALGTDTGGSIRIPAHYCRTIGFKPSYGALPLEGVERLSPSLDHVGMLTDTVATAKRVFHAITPKFAHADVSVPSPLRVGIIPGQLTSTELSEDVARATEHVVDTLRLAGCSIVEVDGSVLADLHSLFGDILLFEAWQEHGERVKSNPQHYGPKTLRLLQSAESVSRDTYEKAMERRHALLPAATRVYDGIDVLLSPAAPFVAPVTTPPVDTPEGDAEGMFTAIFNLTGDPAIVLPCGWSHNGLPIGVQLASALGRDDALLAAAEFTESALDVSGHAPLVDQPAPLLQLRDFASEDYAAFAEWLPTLDDFYQCSGGVEDWPITAERLAERSARNDILAWTAVLVDDPSVAVGHIEFVRTDAASGRFARVLIAPAFRGRGLAAHLVDCGIFAARSIGIRTVNLNVVKGNEPALRTYRSRGFRLLEFDTAQPETVRMTRSL